ncbi:hypothetical protein BRC77_12445 [Halobacteriales archaeon QH_8_64_26]|nr:MAG: hypothetical protein BRC77_12445 [Halobacteriales archaeon QH_8_64_26]
MRFGPADRSFEYRRLFIRILLRGTNGYDRATEGLSVDYRLAHSPIALALVCPDPGGPRR